MGLFQNHMMAAAVASATGPTTYSITNSCRFDGDSILKITPGSDGNRNTWTFSTWFKRSLISEGTALGTIQNIFGGGAIAGTYDCDLYIGSYDTPENGMKVAIKNASDIAKINANFRDPSAWMHVVWRMDTTQGTDSDRMRLYINGNVITDYDDITYPSEDEDLDIPRSGYQISLGAASAAAGPNINGKFFFDGYLAETHFVDGSSLGPDSFGETNSDGVWIPIETSGITYGTHGWFMDYQSSGDLGNDVSGNNNDLASNNLAAANQMEDTPTNNHCTFSSINKSDSVTLTDGNLIIDGSGGGAYYPIIGTQTMASGKWYIEFEQTSTVNVIYGVGSAFIASSVSGGVSGTPGASGEYSDGAGYNLNGALTEQGNSTGGWGSTFTTGDIIAIAIDADTGKVWFAKNNTWQASGDPAAGTNPASTVTTPIALFVTIWGTAPASATMRSAEGDWSYSAPSGFNAINTSNITTPTVKDSSEYFQTELYTGNGTAIGSGGKAVTFTGNASMQPDFVWIKNRDQADSHSLYDSVRGTTKQLETDTTSAETTETEGLTTFGSDGFTVGSLAQVNTNTEDFVSWNWAEGTAPGFDIVSYTGNNTNRTISHSSGAVPKMIIIKSSSASKNWPIYHGGMGNTKAMNVNSYAGPSTTSTYWQDTTPTSSVFSLGTQTDVNTNLATYIAYVWAEVEGFSRFGTYIGNSNTNGPYLWCGFKPRMVIIKAINGNYNWQLNDTARNTYNVTDNTLFPNASYEENSASAGGGNAWDMLSSGFKIRSSSGNVNDGSTFMFAAFAENPFGGDGVSPSPAR